MSKWELAIYSLSFKIYNQKGVSHLLIVIQDLQSKGS
jgi:hypothetical protein